MLSDNGCIDDPTTDSGNIDQLPTDWALSDEVIAEMCRDLDDLQRNHAAFTPEEIDAMEQYERAQRGAFCFSPEELAIIADSRDRRTADLARRHTAALRTA